jgi:hypothetical protein
MLQVCIETGIHGLCLLVGKDILFFLPEGGKMENG